MSASGDGTLKIYNADLYASDNKPTVWWKSSQMATIDSYYTVALKVVDEAGDPIPDAAITLEDKDGTGVWTGGVTDENGESSADILAMTTSKDPDGGNYDSVYDERSPFTLRISKSGFHNYEVIFSLNTKCNWTIALKPRYSTSGTMDSTNQLMWNGDR